MDLSNCKLLYISQCRMCNRKDALVTHLQITLETLSVMHGSFKNLSSQSHIFRWCYLENILGSITHHVNSAYLCMDDSHLTRHRS